MGRKNHVEKTNSSSCGHSYPQHCKLKTTIPMKAQKFLTGGGEFPPFATVSDCIRTSAGRLYGTLRAS